ncbi:MAG: slipin family protein [Lachnospiraceae bacterium]|nr:slipin family protein [Lachnospiraceae bacterium]
MRIIINENEIGYVTRNGQFVKTIRAGIYHYSTLLGYKVIKEEMKGEVEFDEIPVQILEKDEGFKNSTVHFNITDGNIGLIYINGVLNSFAIKNEYIFWNEFEKYEMKLISMENTEFGDEVTKQMLSVIPIRFYTTVVVKEGQVGLLYYDNTLVKKLGAGVYRYWNYNNQVTYDVVDLKQTEFNIAGQEILTKDKIGIRMNLSCVYRIVNAEGVAKNINNLANQLYSFTQLVIREMTGNYKLDEILEMKDQISNEIFEKMKEGEKALYVEFISVGIKDIILPGEIKSIMNTVLVAEKSAQANVIARREEVASTRSLLNTAKLMDENKTLYKLKELEYLEKICEKVGEISVGGNAGMLEELSKICATQK